MHDQDGTALFFALFLVPPPVTITTTLIFVSAAAVEDYPSSPESKCVVFLHIFCLSFSVSFPVSVFSFILILIFQSKNISQFKSKNGSICSREFFCSNLNYALTWRSKFCIFSWVGEIDTVMSVFCFLVPVPVSRPAPARPMAPLPPISVEELVASTPHHIEPQSKSGTSHEDAGTTGEHWNISPIPSAASGSQPLPPSDGKQETGSITTPFDDDRMLNIVRVFAKYHGTAFIKSHDWLIALSNYRTPIGWLIFWIFHGSFDCLIDGLIVLIVLISGISVKQACWGLFINNGSPLQTIKWLVEKGLGVRTGSQVTLKVDQTLLEEGENAITALASTTTLPVKELQRRLDFLRLSQVDLCKAGSAENMTSVLQKLHQHRFEPPRIPDDEWNQRMAIFWYRGESYAMSNGVLRRFV